MLVLLRCCWLAARAPHELSGLLKATWAQRLALAAAPMGGRRSEDLRTSLSLDVAPRHGSKQDDAGLK